MNKEKTNITKKDFVLVQQDKQIHDLKFDTKPTTYFKDAMRRFVKNKSSVAASVIIGILVLLAIFVPIFNKNNIEGSNSNFNFLPPRWRGFENSSVLNGREYIEGIVTNMDDPDGPLPNGYTRSAIVGELDLYESFTNTAHRNAKGGSVKLTSDTHLEDLYWQSAKVYTDFADEYIVEFDVDAELNEDTYFEFYANMQFLGKPEQYIPLVEKTNIYGEYTVNVSEIVVATLPEEEEYFDGQVRFGFRVFKPEEGTDRKSLYVNSVVIKNLTNPNDTRFDLHNFVEANELLLRQSDDSKAPYRFTIDLTTGSRGRVTLYNGIITRANFYYDYYEEAYGLKRKNVGKSTMDQYVSNGFFTYEYELLEDDRTIVITSFTILDDKRSPVRQLYGGRKVSAFGEVAFHFDAEVSIYREQGYTEYPYFFFGTNQRGHDFFKVIFSGLRTSLILGVSAAAINILIGLIWGAISGYYGGTVDLVMERFTEILGGIPWIVIMTLAILHLGNTFEVFLLALILTGWIGVAATTRSQFYRYKRREYVLASRTLGARDGRLIFKHILPNSIGPIVTGAVLMIPGIIFSEATISYLGLGLQGLQSMGVALSEAQEFIHTSPFLIVSGSIVIALLLISFNLFGNGLRDAFNPSLKGSE